jgi:hypothetical protein
MQLRLTGREPHPPAKVGAFCIVRAVVSGEYSCKGQRDERVRAKAQGHNCSGWGRRTKRAPVWRCTLRTQGRAALGTCQRVKSARVSAALPAHGLTNYFIAVIVALGQQLAAFTSGAAHYACARAS